MAIDLWGREINLPAEQAVRGFSGGEQVILYLRPEEVLILREGKPIKEALRQYIFTGKVIRILDRGTHQWVLYQPLGLNMHLEIHLPNYVFRNLSIQEGQPLRVAIRKESFWVIPEKSS